MDDADRDIELARLQRWIETLAETLDDARRREPCQALAQEAFGVVVRIAMAGRRASGSQLVVTQAMPGGGGCIPGRSR